MIQLIVILIFLLPILAICKIIAEALGISKGRVVIYVFTWIFGLFLYNVGVIDSLISVFLMPFISEFAFLIIVKLYIWTFKTIQDEKE